MPITEDEWESGLEWDAVQRAVAAVLRAGTPHAYSVPELHAAVTDPSAAVHAPEADIETLDVAEGRVEEAVQTLVTADYLEAKEIDTGDGPVTYYRREEFGMEF
jgi:hypothetical protein